MPSTHSTRQRDSLSDDAIRDLQSRLDGRVYRHGDDAYETARQLWNGVFDRHPALIARCAGTADVVAAVDFAREHGLTPAARCGGHGEAGHAMPDDGLVIDLSQMNEVRINPDKRLASAGGGATWNSFDAATHEHGLATTGGIISSVGVGGLTLGGGFGWLMRSCGMTCDNLVSAEVVTASGDVMRVSESDNRDLLWGLRGGGGNFGVVTRFDLRLHPVSTVLGGMIAHPIERARDALSFYRDFMDSAPDGLSVYSVLMTTPDGAKMIAFVICYAGDPDDGAKVIKPLAEWSEPVMSQVGPMPYPQMQQMLDEPNPPGLPRYFRGELFQRLDDGVIDAMVDRFDEVPSPLSVVILESLGGAAGRVPADATAFGHRDAKYSVVISAQWTDPSLAGASVDWAQRTEEAFRPFASGAYVNYLGDDGEERIRTAYDPDTYGRLAELKSKFDPDNLFRANQNIQPRR